MHYKLTTLARNAVIALGLAGGLAAGVLAAPLDHSIALDAVYIPALSLTTGAQTDAAVAVKARAAMQRLDAGWPNLRAALLKDLSGSTPAQAAAARKTLAKVDASIAASRKAVAGSDFKTAHNALEAVRIDLMHLRVAQGTDYFMDRLTAFHEPLEVLALTGSGTAPQDLTPAKRAELERAFAEARALWRGIEQNLPNPQAYGLKDARLAQFNKGLADESAALSRLSDALRGNDNAALLKAAMAIKPPFSRTFTAFGQYN